MADKKRKQRARGVGDAAIEAIRAGKNNEDALKAVQKEFPGSKTTLGAIAWYRNKLRGDGETIPTAREMRKAAKAARKRKAKSETAGDPTA